MPILILKVKKDMGKCKPTMTLIEARCLSLWIDNYSFCIMIWQNFIVMGIGSARDRHALLTIIIRMHGMPGHGYYNFIG